jgi:hypothetical protein
MLPTELKTIIEESNNASRKMRVSWFSSASKAPSPSVSINNTGIALSPPLSTLIYRFQIHSPLVHGLIEDPTSNPLYLSTLDPFWSKNNLLSKYDLPVRYLPQMAIIAIGSVMVPRKSFAS